MSEYTTMYQAALAGLAIVAASFFYSWGGRSGKWKRRFIASFILACAVNGLLAWRGIWNPLALITYPILCIGFSLGYGAEELLQKIFKRMIYAITICLSGLLLAFVLGGNAWFVLIPHVGIAAFSVYLGTRNPIEAAAEEFFICMVLNLGLMMYPFIGA